MKKGLKVFGMIIIGMLVLSVFSYLFADEETKKEIATEEVVAEIQKEKEAEEKKKVEAEKKRMKSITETDLTDEGLTTALKNHNEKIDSATIKDGNLLITFKDDLTFTDSFKDTTHYSAEIFKEVFKRDDIVTARISFPLTFIDNLGNTSIQEGISITLNKELSAKINYDNFINMLVLHPAYMYNTASSYYIHPAIYRDIESEHLKEMNDGFVR